MIYLWHVFLNWTGASNTSGTAYGFWSGFGSDLAEVAILGSVVQLYRNHNCHVKGCWRIGKYPFKHYKLCQKHSPHVPKGGVTHQHIIKLHKGVE